MSDHIPIVGTFVDGTAQLGRNVDDGPSICMRCLEFLCLDGYPERIDGAWIHVKDYKERERAKKALTLIDELEALLAEKGRHVPGLLFSTNDGLRSYAHNPAIEIGVIRAIVDKYKRSLDEL